MEQPIPTTEAKPMETTVLTNLATTDAFQNLEITRTFVEVTNVTMKPESKLGPGSAFDIAMDCLLGFALAIAAYLVLVLSYHEWFLYSTGTSSRRRGAKIGKVRIGPWLRILCILSAIFCLLRCINDIIYYHAKLTSDVYHTVIKNMGVAWLVGVDTTVYLFLWVRQKILYLKRSMKRLANPVLSFICWFSLSLIVATFITTNILLLWRRYYNKKCTGVCNTVKEVHSKLFPISSSVLHFLLVGLFVYPLLKHMANLRHRGKGASKGNNGDSRMLQKETAASSKGQNSLMSVVARCMAISLVCVLTDGVTIAITNLWVTAVEFTKLRHFLYDINIIINVFAIVASFRNWKIMLCPFACTRNLDGDLSDSPRRDSLFTTSSNPNVVNRVVS